MDSVLVLGVILVAMCVVECPAEQKIRPCEGQHVCTTLMRYPDGYTADEGPNCLCQSGACGDTWEENSDATLTWQHYERSHWTVQYKFCRSLFSGHPTCKPEERSATVTTAMKSWQPILTEPRCKCPNRLMQLQGWKREGSQWKYIYVCDKDICPDPPRGKKPEQAKCAKIYIDPYKTSDKVIEVQFLCSCPEGQMCPARLLKKDDNSVLTDEAGGSYVYKFCENNHQTSDETDA